jgi:hypothetical protein
MAASSPAWPLPHRHGRFLTGMAASSPAWLLPHRHGRFLTVMAASSPACLFPHRHGCFLPGMAASSPAWLRPHRHGCFLTVMAASSPACLFPHRHGPACPGHLSRHVLQQVGRTGRTTTERAHRSFPVSLKRSMRRRIAIRRQRAGPPGQGKTAFVAYATMSPRPPTSRAECPRRGLGLWGRAWRLRYALHAPPGRG